MSCQCTVPGRLDDNRLPLSLVRVSSIDRNNVLGDIRPQPWPPARSNIPEVVAAINLGHYHHNTLFACHPNHHQSYPSYPAPPLFQAGLSLLTPCLLSTTARYPRMAPKRVANHDYTGEEKPVSTVLGAIHITTAGTRKKARTVTKSLGIKKVNTEGNPPPPTVPLLSTPHAPLHDILARRTVKDVTH